MERRVGTVLDRCLLPGPHPCRKENNGNDPSVNLISKTGGWGSTGGGAAPADDAAGKHPERAIPAQPTPAWGGAGLPEERKKQVGAGRRAGAAHAVQELGTRRKGSLVAWLRLR